MHRPPYAPSESILSRGIGTQIAWIGPVIGTALILLGWVVWNASGETGGDETLLATMIFTSLAFVQLARALASRSFHEPVWRTGVRGNPVLIGMLAAALTLQLAVVYLPFAQELFGTTALTVGQVAVGVGLALAVLVLMELDKALRHLSTAETPGRRRQTPHLVA